MNKQIFVINGSGGVGKDTFVELIGKYKPIVNFSSVDKIKEVARLIGWDGGKSEKDRKFLSDLKLLTTNYNNMPYNSMVDCIKRFRESDNIFLFLHVREPEEIQKIVNEFSAKTIIVKRNIEQIISNMADANVFNYCYDYEIDNSGTIEKLEERARNFIFKVTT